MSMILARESRASEWPAPRSEDRVGGFLPRWMLHTLVVVTLLLLIAVPLALSFPSLAAPPSDDVVVVPGAVGTGVTAHSR